MSIFRRATQEKVRVDRLWNRSQPRTTDGSIASGGVGGPAETHDHRGTGEGGSTLQPAILKLKAAVALTIAAGVVTATQGHHTIDTEAAAASDDLDTVNGLTANEIYVLRPANDAKTVVVKHGTGNIKCWNNADYTLDDVHDWVWGFSPDGTTLYVLGDSQGAGAVATDVIWDAIGDLAVGTGANTAARLAAPSPSEAANTTPSAFTNWAAQSGNARKMLFIDPATGQIEWDYLTAIDVLTPAQVLTFTVQPAAAGYPDDTSGSAMVASSGTDTPRFAMTYQGTPTAATIDIQSETYAGSPEVNPSDYPATVLTPFTSLDGPAINRGAAVSESVTFRITATVDGQSKTKDVTLTYLNERMWGISTEADIDTEAEINTFRTAQNKELSNSRSKTFSVTAGASEYIYWVQRTALGTPTFTVGGFEGGFQLVGSAVTWANPRGFSETYDVWRSDLANLGATTVVVS